MEVINHSKVGGSGAHRFWECEGSVALGERAKREGKVKDTSMFAKEGTAAHLLAEICFRDDDIAESYIGSLIDVEDDVVKVSQDMADAVQVYIDVVKEDFNKYVAMFGSAFLGIETEFKLDDIDSDAFGVNDAYIFIPASGHLIVYDYKHGKGVLVEVENNKQLQYYSLGAINKIDEKVLTIETVIVQPRKPKHGAVARRFSYSIEEIEKFKIELKEKIQATKKPVLQLKAGSWCKFCPAILICEIAEKQTWKQNTTYSVSQAVEDFN